MSLEQTRVHDNIRKKVADKNRSKLVYVLSRCSEHQTVREAIKWTDQIVLNLMVAYGSEKRLSLIRVEVYRYTCSVQMYNPVFGINVEEAASRIIVFNLRLWKRRVIEIGKSLGPRSICSILK
jgi:hypothetical protein